MFNTALKSPLQKALKSGLVSLQDLVDDINFASAGAFSQAFSTDFDIFQSANWEYSNAFSQAFASFQFRRDFSPAFSNAFAIQNK